MNGDKEKELGPNEQVPESSKVSMGRRKFSKAGVVAPVLMTFSSRPAWAACTLSGMMSGNLSNPNSMEDCAGALSAAYWNENRDQWGGRLSQDVNGFFDLVPPYFNGTTFEAIYNGEGTPSISFGTEFESAFIELLIQAIAAVLNVDHFGDGYPFTITDIKNYVRDAYNADKAESSKTLKKARASTKVRTSSRRSTSNNRRIPKKGGAANMIKLTGTIKDNNEVNARL